MKIKDVLILIDAVKDLNDGKFFYDKKEVGVGNYFWYRMNLMQLLPKQGLMNGHYIY